MKLMFTTAKGSEYFMLDDGTWVRKRYDGKAFTGYVYLGSIDTSQNPAFVKKGDYYDSMINQQFASGVIPGFRPSFEVDCAPIGVIGAKPGDIVFYQVLNRLGLTKKADPNTKVRIHIGDSIDRIFEESLAKDQKWLK